MRRVGREVVPEAKSSCSTRATECPRSAASRAIPAPMMPPPMTRRSTVRPLSDRTVSSRVFTLGVRLVVLVDRRVHFGGRGIEGGLARFLAQQDRLDHLVHACAGLRH